MKTDIDENNTRAYWFNKCENCQAAINIGQGRGASFPYYWDCLVYQTCMASVKECTGIKKLEPDEWFYLIEKFNTVN